MPSTNVASNSAIARKAYGGALFTRLTRGMGFRGKITGPAPKDAAAARELRQQTAAGYPVVQITDLQKEAGDEVKYDIVDVIRGKPIMGDNRLSGRTMALNFAQQQIRIDQYRGAVDPGGRMTKQRTIWDLRRLAKGNLEGWNSRLLDQLHHVHLAGARGTDGGRDWVIPHTTDPDFSDIVVNSLAAPSFNRRYVVGNGVGAITGLDSADTLTLEVIDDIRTRIDSSDYPLQGIRLDGDAAVDDDMPLYCMYVSPAGYNQLRASSTDKDWSTLVSNALQRQSISKHPLFGNGALMWRGIVIKQLARPVSFAAGDLVSEYTDATTLANTAAPVKFHRAILMGAQAMVSAWGMDSSSGMPIKWHEEETDHGNRVEFSTSMIGGFKKLTFTIDDTITDHGVWAIDHYNDL
jgi:N4-gp56 family major capsid protein